MPKLSESEFKETFGNGMRDITGMEITGGAIEIMPYIKAIAKIDWESFEQWDEFVEKVYENEKYHHVLVMTKTTNVYMAVVIRRDVGMIKGHYLLNLNEEYGVNNGRGKVV